MFFVYDKKYSIVDNNVEKSRLCFIRKEKNDAPIIIEKDFNSTFFSEIKMTIKSPKICGLHKDIFSYQILMNS